MSKQNKPGIIFKNQPCAVFELTTRIFLGTSHTEYATAAVVEVVLTLMETALFLFSSLNE